VSGDYPEGVVLLTGTGIVPPNDFTLAAGDTVRVVWIKQVDVQITSIETLQWTTYPRLLVVRVHTDDGISGLGESVDKVHGTKAALHGTVAPLVLGQDPLDIEGIWRFVMDNIMYHGYAGAETRALSALELALWDIMGKKYGAPLYHLLGGKTRDRIPTYSPH
jgi:L-alanine-DL-glutamate epimerase-like enolase superfamily enzyme